MVVGEEELLLKGASPTAAPQGANLGYTTRVGGSATVSLAYRGRLYRLAREVPSSLLHRLSANSDLYDINPWVTGVGDLLLTSISASEELQIMNCDSQDLAVA